MVMPRQNSELIITVAGKVGTGKTAVANLLKRALAVYDIDATVNPLPGDNDADISDEMLGECMNALSNANAKVIINQQQLQRDYNHESDNPNS